MPRLLQLSAVALALVACKPKPAAPVHEHVEKWTLPNGDVATGVREIVNPPPPKVAPPPPWPASAPKLITTLGPAEPGGCSARDVPTAAEWKKLQQLLAGESGDDVEAVAIANGCARLRQLRHGGEVARWQWRRSTGGAFTAAIDWEFAPGVKQPSTIARFSLTQPLDRPAEWADGALLRKRFVFAADGGQVDDFTRYPGEPALYQLGDPPRRISATTPTQLCRGDGSNHCTTSEAMLRARFESGLAF